MKGLSDVAFDETQGRMDEVMEGKVKMGRQTQSDTCMHVTNAHQTHVLLKWLLDEVQQSS